MEQWVGAVAIVTGSSSGIGASISTELVKKGLKVVGLARRIDRLNELKESLKNERGEFHPIQCNILFEDEILAAFDYVRKHFGMVHLLVNNAGGSRNSNLSRGKTGDWKEIIDLNLIGLCIATREACKLMGETKIDGLIIHMNSIAGHFPITSNAPTLSVYGASKYGVTAVAETLRLELASRHSKIRITSISPGAVRTDIVKASGYADNKAIQELLSTIPQLEPIDVANAVMYVMSTPVHMNITELIIRPTGETL